MYYMMDMFVYCISKSPLNSRSVMQNEKVERLMRILKSGMVNIFALGKSTFFHSGEWNRRGQGLIFREAEHVTVKPTEMVSSSWEKEFHIYLS